MYAGKTGTLAGSRPTVWDQGSGNEVLPPYQHILNISYNLLQISDTNESVLHAIPEAIRPFKDLMLTVN